MFVPRSIVSFVLIIFATAGPVVGQTVIYSGREYLQHGRSWLQIREVDLATGRHTQLTTHPHNHSNPWCGPNKDSILFTSSRSGRQKSLFRFHRVTKQEILVVTLEQDLFAIVGAVDDSRIVVQEYGSVIEIVDIAARQKMRRISGVNPTIAPNQKVMAWQTSVPISNPDQKSHILLSNIDGSNSIDLGEGTAPFFMFGGTQLVFARFDKETDQLDIGHYKIEGRLQEVQPTRGIEIPIREVYDLTASPDGSTMVLSTDGGRYGSAVFWRMTARGEWSIVDENLHPWGGWSADGRLIYATDGRDLRPLDAQRNVWVSDIKLLDQHSGKTSTVVSGVSLNEDPCWCDRRN